MQLIVHRGTHEIGGNCIAIATDDSRIREANADVPEIATLEVQTARPRLFKAGAVVKTSVRRIWFHFSSNWPTRDTFRRACEAAARFAAEVRAAVGGADPPEAHPALLM